MKIIQCFSFYSQKKLTKKISDIFTEPEGFHVVYSVTVL